MKVVIYVYVSGIVRYMVSAQIEKDSLGTSCDTMLLPIIALKCRDHIQISETFGL